MNLPERHTLGHTCKVHCYKNLEVLTQRLNLLTNVKIKEFHDQKVLCTEPVLFIIAICNLFFSSLSCTVYNWCRSELNWTEKKFILRHCIQNIWIFFYLLKTSCPWNKRLNMFKMQTLRYKKHKVFSNIFILYTIYCIVYIYCTGKKGQFINIRSD